MDGWMGYSKRRARLVAHHPDRRMKRERESKGKQGTKGVQREQARRKGWKDKERERKREIEAGLATMLSICLRTFVSLVSEYGCVLLDGTCFPTKSPFTAATTFFCEK